MFVYYFVYPNLRVEVFFEKEGDAQKQVSFVDFWCKE